MLINEIITQKTITGITEYLIEHYPNSSLSIYSSVDVRNAGFKVVPVDTNLFPAGFNNLSNEAVEQFSIHLKEYLAENGLTNAHKILIIAEDYTRNLKYLENISRLGKIIKDLGFEVEIGSITETRSITLESGEDIKVTKLEKKDSKACTSSGFTPDIILLNNDLTQSIPQTLESIEQPIFPNPVYTWYRRRKYNHFVKYNELVSKLSKQFNFDPWLISTSVVKCDNVDFKTRTGIDCVTDAVDKIIDTTTKKFQQYNIKQEPFVFIKADRGTNGLGIMSVKSAEEISSMNKKLRHSMHSIKYGVLNDEIVIQEGVITTFKHKGATAENIIYLVGQNPVGSLIRYNPEQGATYNLNSKGAVVTAGETKNEIEKLVARIAACSVYDEIS